MFAGRSGGGGGPDSTHRGVQALFPVPTCFSKRLALASTSTFFLARMKVA